MHLEHERVAGGQAHGRPLGEVGDGVVVLLFVCSDEVDSVSDSFLARDFLLLLRFFPVPFPLFAAFSPSGRTNFKFVAGSSPAVSDDFN